MIKLRLLRSDKQQIEVTYLCTFVFEQEDRQVHAGNSNKCSYCLFKKLLACVLHNVGMLDSEEFTQAERFWLDC